MTTTETQVADDAARWAMRLAADASGDAAMTAEEWTALTLWLEGGEARRQALDLAQDTLELEIAPLDAARHRRAGRDRGWRGLVWAAGGAAVAAGVAGVAVVAPWREEAPRTYAAGPAATARAILADGSTVVLNRGARVSVAMRRDGRSVALSPGGEAVFDVVHDSARPFVVRAGGDEVRVLGTVFDVDDGGGALRVGVARGAVAVRLAAAPGRTWRVPAGFRLAQAAGGATLTPVPADTVGAWRRGALVYDGAPLSQVASDLSRYWGRPVEAEGAVAGRRFTGTLAIDTPQAMARRLELFAPITVDVEPGRTLLRARRARP